MEESHFKSWLGFIEVDGGGIECLLVHRDMTVLGYMSGSVGFYCEGYKRLKTVNGHSARVQAIAGWRDFALTGSMDRYIKVWRLKSPRCHQSIDTGQDIKAMKTFGSKMFVAVPDSFILVVDLRQMEIVQRIEGNAQTSVLSMTFFTKYFFTGGASGTVDCYNVQPNFQNSGLLVKKGDSLFTGSPVRALRSSLKEGLVFVRTDFEILCFCVTKDNSGISQKSGYSISPSASTSSLPSFQPLEYVRSIHTFPTRQFSDCLCVNDKMGELLFSDQSQNAIMIYSTTTLEQIRNFILPSGSVGDAFLTPNRVFVKSRKGMNVYQL